MRDCCYLTHADKHRDIPEDNFNMRHRVKDLDGLSPSVTSSLFPVLLRLPSFHCGDNTSLWWPLLHWDRLVRLFRPRQFPYLQCINLALWTRPAWSKGTRNPSAELCPRALEVVSCGAVVSAELINRSVHQSPWSTHGSWNCNGSTELKGSSNYSWKDFNAFVRYSTEPRSSSREKIKSHGTILAMGTDEDSKVAPNAENVP